MRLLVTSSHCVRERLILQSETESEAHGTEDTTVRTLSLYSVLLPLLTFILGTCQQCNHGDFQLCTNRAINGVTRPGGCK